MGNGRRSVFTGKERPVPSRLTIRRFRKNIGPLASPFSFRETWGGARMCSSGTEKAMEETFGSTCHGAGRVMSRHQAIKAAKGRDIARELEDKGIIVKGASRGTLVEEIPEAYKDVNDVVNVVHQAGISKKVVKLVPLGVIKG